MSSFEDDGRGGAAGSSRGYGAASSRYTHRTGIVGGLRRFLAMIASFHGQHNASWVATGLRSVARTQLYAWTTFAPYLYELVGHATTTGEALATEWACAGLSGPQISRGGFTGSTPLVNGCQPMKSTHAGVCALFNNPVDGCITSASADGRAHANPDHFFGTSLPLADTAFFFGHAMRILCRVHVPFFDCWPFVGVGRNVGVRAADAACRAAVRMLLNTLVNLGFYYFIVATGAGWYTICSALDRNDYRIVGVEVGVEGEVYDVEVLIGTASGRPIFFVKCPHFCTWNDRKSRRGIIAALVCTFELSGQPVDDTRVGDLL